MAVAPVLALLATLVAAQDLADDPPVAPPVREELQQLRARLEVLEGRGAAAQGTSIDLSGDELPALAPAAEHVLARAWFENVRLSGYAAFTYLDSGRAGTSPDGSFVVKETSLFLDTELWERTFLFSELWLARYQYVGGITLAELYLQFTAVLGPESPTPLGAKVGRFELPFGEEYLRWDAHETPFVTFSAADPFGLDEGLQLYGELGGVHWIGALTNGTVSAGADEGVAKLVCGRLYGEPHPLVHLGASFLQNDGTAESALRLSGSTLTPVGAAGTSSAGTSPSDEIDTRLWQLDARLGGERRARLGLSFGQGRIDDDADAFDRGLAWFLVEPTLRLRDDLELVLRWSGIGTDDDDEGYRFAGRVVADGEELGYDVQRFRRASAGLRWSVHPRLALKLEVGQDRFDLIPGSPLDAEDDERTYFAVELVGSF